MPKKDDIFLEEEISSANNGFTYANGFRFGFGFFTAWLLGLVIVSALGAGAAALLAFTK